MSTRSVIALAEGRNIPAATKRLSIRWVYCHFDGYPEPPGVGYTLRKHYKERSKILALIELGDLSSLGDSLDDSYFYTRDGGEPAESNAAGRVWTLNGLSRVAKESGAEYAYVFGVDGERWLYAEIPYRGKPGEYLPLPDEAAPIVADVALHPTAVIL